MADVKIQNVKAGQAANETLKQAKDKLQTTADATKASFDVLKSIDPDMGSKFISEYNGSMTDMITFLNSIYSAAAAYFKDDDGDGDGDGDDYGGPRGGPKGTNPPKNTDPPKGTDPPTEPKTDPPKGKKINSEPLQTMKLSELDGFIGELIALAKQKNLALDELLADDKYADELLKILLESPYLPKEFKELLTDMDSKIVRQFLESILKGEEPGLFSINSLNLGIMFSYLSDYATENGITVEQLLSDSSNADLLKKALSGFSNVISLYKGWEDMDPEQFQENLSNIYDGYKVDELPIEDVVVSRSFVDYVSQESEIPPDDLLTDKTYASTLQEAIKQFTKCLTFFSASSSFSTKGMMNNVSQMFDGRNYKAYGMTEDNVSSFMKEMDALASSNGVSVTKLLSDSSYADSVSATLQKCSSAKGVESIYKNQSAKYVQKVAKNLYFSTTRPVEEYTNPTYSEGVIYVDSSVDSETGEVTSTYEVN